MRYAEQGRLLLPLPVSLARNVLYTPQRSCGTIDYGYVHIRSFEPCLSHSINQRETSLTTQCLATESPHQKASYQPNLASIATQKPCADPCTIPTVHLLSQLVVSVDELPQRHASVRLSDVTSPQRSADRISQIATLATWSKHEPRTPTPPPCRSRAPPIRSNTASTLRTTRA